MNNKLLIKSETTEINFNLVSLIEEKPNVKKQTEPIVPNSEMLLIPIIMLLNDFNFTTITFLYLRQVFAALLLSISATLHKLISSAYTDHII